jgi:hypothetical protein
VPRWGLFTKDGENEHLIIIDDKCEHKVNDVESKVGLHLICRRSTCVNGPSFDFQTLNLWDCGGQEAFMENYFASQRENIFRNVEVENGFFCLKKDIFFAGANAMILAAPYPSTLLSILSA